MDHQALDDLGKNCMYKVQTNIADALSLAVTLGKVEAVILQISLGYALFNLAVKSVMIEDRITREDAVKALSGEDFDEVLDEITKWIEK